MKTTTVTIILLCSTLLHGQVQFGQAIVLESPHAQANGWFGAEGVDTVPDVNDDGVADILVGALGEEPPGSPADAGRVYVFDGQTRTLLTELKLPNEVSGAELGSKIAGIGDLNGNGSGDVLAATGSGQNRVYVFDGSSGEVLHTIFMRGRSLSAVPDATGDNVPDMIVSTNSSAVIYNGATGARHKSLVPPPGSTNMFGWSCAGVADVNGDGKGDVVVGDWQAARAHLFDGATGSLLRTLSASGGAAAAFGRSVAGLRDATGDGRGDVVVGASDSGAAYVFDGARGRLINTLLAPPADNARGFGWVVAELPDVTGDGLSDVTVLGRPNSATLGSAYLFDGLARGQASLAALTGNRDFGGGGSIAGAPDLNGDGLGEVLVANWTAASSAGHPNAGHVLLYLSASGTPAEDTMPTVAHENANITVTWEPGIYDTLHFSTDGRTWRQVPDVDARTTGSFTEPQGIRGASTLYRLQRE